jgi:hypothetical protein
MIVGVKLVVFSVQRKVLSLLSPPVPSPSASLELVEFGDDEDAEGLVEAHGGREALHVRAPVEADDGLGRDDAARGRRERERERGGGWTRG